MSSVIFHRVTPISPRVHSLTRVLHNMQEFILPIKDDIVALDYIV